MTFSPLCPSLLASPHCVPASLLVNTFRVPFEPVVTSPLLRPTFNIITSSSGSSSTGLSSSGSSSLVSSSSGSWLLGSSSPGYKFWPDFGTIGNEWGGKNAILLQKPPNIVIHCHTCPYIATLYHHVTAILCHILPYTTIHCHTLSHIVKHCHTFHHCLVTAIQ